MEFVVLKASNPNARYCYERALAARDRAVEAKYPEDRLFYFEAEARWLKLAESYDFSARAGQFIASRSPQRPSCPTCAEAMLLAEVQVLRGAVEYRYECRECGNNIYITGRND
jgi:ribosomal protein S27AE